MMRTTTTKLKNAITRNTRDDVCSVGTNVGDAHMNMSDITTTLINIRVSECISVKFRTTCGTMDYFQFRRTYRVLSNSSINTNFFRLLDRVSMMVRVMFVTIKVRGVANMTRYYFYCLATFTSNIGKRTRVIRAIRTIRSARGISAIFNYRLGRLLGGVVQVTNMTCNINATRRRLRRGIQDDLARLYRALPKTFVRRTVNCIGNDTTPTFGKRRSKGLTNNVTRGTRRVNDARANYRRKLVHVARNNIYRRGLLLYRCPFDRAFESTNVGGILDARH